MCLLDLNTPQNLLSTFGKAISIYQLYQSQKQQIYRFVLIKYNMICEVWGRMCNEKGERGKLSTHSRLLGGWYLFRLEFVCVRMFVIMAKCCPEDRSSFEYLPSFFNVCLWIDFVNTVASQTHKM